MNDLLKELEAVALLADRLDQLSDAVAAQRWNEFSMRVPAEPHRDADLVLASIARFLRTHHAEIAEAVRVNRAVREVAENWRVLARVSGSKVDRYAFKFFAYQLDAAIDAHNSAREDGE